MDGRNADVPADQRLQPDYSVAWVERASPLVNASDRDVVSTRLRPSVRNVMRKKFSGVA
jgi:hypothetical protein